MTMSKELQDDYSALYNKSGHKVIESLTGWPGIIGEMARDCMKVGIEYHSH